MKYLSKYVRGLFQHAFHAFERAEVVRAVIFGIIGLGVVLLAVSGFGIKPPAHIAEWTIGLAFIFLLLVFAPYRLWRSERIQVERLQDEMKSHLLLEFNDRNPSCIADTRLRDNYGPDAKYFR